MSKVGFRLGFALLYGAFFLSLPAGAQTLEPSVQDRARQIGEELKKIETAITETRQKQVKDEAAATVPITAAREQEALLNRELASIRNIYRTDRVALGVVDGRPAAESKADPKDVKRAAELRVELATMAAQIRDGQTKFNAVRQQAATELARHDQARTRLNLELTRMKAPFAANKEALAVIDEKFKNGQGLQSPAQIATANAAKAAADAAKAADARDAPGREAIAAAQAEAPGRLVGQFTPKNQAETDIRKAALMALEAHILKASPRVGDKIVQDRLNQINGEVIDLKFKYGGMISEGTPFEIQWRALAGDLTGATRDNLIPPLKALVAPTLEKAAARAEKIEQRAKAEEQAKRELDLVGRVAMVVLAVGGIGAFVLVGYLVRKWNRGRVAAVRRLNDVAWRRLGNTPEARAQGISQMFDQKREILSFVARRNLAGPKAENAYVQFRISRSLMAMDAKEREFLRSTFLLRNAGLLDDDSWEYYQFAFIYGDGKASIDDCKFSAPESEGIKNARAAVESYQRAAGASVDSAVNALLGVIRKAEQNPTGSAVVQDLKSRLSGGSAWFEPGDVAGSVFAPNENYALRLGTIEGSNQPLTYSGEGSLITIAPPGSGKTQCFVLPNMLTWGGSAVILDVKGEIYAATAKWRADHVGPVFKFSPLDPENSHSYNPLSFVRRDPDYLWEDSRFLADMLMVPSNASDPFWENMARDVLTGAIAYVCYHNRADERPFSKILDILYGIGWDEMISALKTNLEVSAMRQAGSSLADLEKKTRDTVLKTAQSSLSAWQGGRLARTTRKSDWSPLDLRSKKITVYICVNPNEIDSYLSVLRVFIAQHIRLLTNELPARGSAPVLFVLDELPRLKKMPPVDEALNIGRQYGIRLWMFTQSYGQLKEAYPNAEGMLGSCAVRMFMNVPLNDELTAKLSEMLGYRDGPLDNTRIKLVEPMELAGPAFKNTVLVLATNTKPAKVTKAFAYRDPELVKRMTPAA